MKNNKEKNSGDKSLIDKKAEKIKEQIRKNEYKISPEKVAEKMLQFLRKIKKK